MRTTTWILALGLGGCFGGNRVPALVKALGHPKPETRAMAAQKLGEMGDPAKPAIPALTQAMRDRHSSVYRAVGDALLKLGEDARPGLLSLARDSAGWLRCRAVETLARFPASPDMAPVFMRALEDHDQCVQGKAVDALARLGGPAVSGLVRALKHPNPALRRGAAEALSRMPPDVQERAAFPLVVDLRGKDEYARGEAELLLSEMGSAATGALLSLAEDPDADLRRRVVVILGRAGAGEPSVPPVLIARLADKDRLVRLKAAMSLGQIGERDASVLPLLMARLSAESSPDLRRGLVAAVGNMGHSARDAVPALISLLSDGDRAVREEASESLMKIGTYEAMDAAERYNRSTLK